MKVLLAPQIGNISYSLMTRQLIPLLLEKEITVGVCALDKMSSKVSFFPALPVRSPFFNFGAENRATAVRPHRRAYRPRGIYAYEEKVFEYSG